METSKQKGETSSQAARITKNVAPIILERLNGSGQRSPSGRKYTFDMIRNWLYGKSRDPKIEACYLKVTSEIDSVKDEATSEKRKAAMMHLEMAEKLLSEI